MTERAVESEFEFEMSFKMNFQMSFRVASDAVRCHQMSVWSELASACDANDLNVIRLRLSDVKRLYGASSVSIVECAAADGDRIISAAATAFASRSPLSCEYAPAVRIISRRRAGLSALYERNVLCGIVAAALIGGSADALAECAKLLINLAVIDRAALAQTMTQQETPEQVIAAAISAAKSQSRDAIFSWTRYADLTRLDASDVDDGGINGAAIACVCVSVCSYY